MEQVKASVLRIRYNTDSDGKTLLWRLIIDGQERLCNSIKIEKPCFTSTDWIPGLNCFKHHISVADCTISINPLTLEAVVC